MKNVFSLRWLSWSGGSFFEPMFYEKHDFDQFSVFLEAQLWLEKAKANIYLILAQYPLTLTNQDLHMPESQPYVAPQHRSSKDSSWAWPRHMS